MCAEQSTARDVLAAIKALDAAVDGLYAISMMETCPGAAQFAEDTLREINAVMGGDRSRCYRVPTVRGGSVLEGADDLLAAADRLDAALGQGRR